MEKVFYNLCARWRKENKDVLGEKPVKNGPEEMLMRKKAEKMHGLNIMKGFSTLSSSESLHTCQMNHG